MGVKTTIDGIDIFQFSEDRTPDGEPAFQYFVIAAGATQVIPGWHHSTAGNQNFRSFLVTAYGQGAHSRLGLPAKGNLGVIHLQFVYTRPVPPGGRSTDLVETGFGEFLEAKTEPVSDNSTCRTPVCRFGTGEIELRYTYGKKHVVGAE